MKKHQVVLLALAAVFAFSAILAATASAETTLLAEWLIKNVGVATLTTTETKGSLVLADNGIGAEVECTGVFDGSVGANGEDEVTKILGTKGEEITLAKPLTLCKSLKGCEASPAPELAPTETLPWHSLMFLDEPSGKFLDNVFQEAGFEITCSILKIKDTDVCKLANETGELVNPATGGAEGVGQVSPLASCSLGGTGKGLEEFLSGNKIETAATPKEAVLVSE